MELSEDLSEDHIYCELGLPETALLLGKGGERRVLKQEYGIHTRGRAVLVHRCYGLSLAVAELFPLIEYKNVIYSCRGVFYSASRLFHRHFICSCLI